MTSRKNKNRVKKHITDRPAPYLPGLYALQAVSADPKGPDVTVYRETAKAAVKWKDQAAHSGKYKKFMLRHGVDAWDVYGPDGLVEYYCNDILSGPMPRELEDDVSVDREELIKEAKDAVMDENIVLVVSSESRPGCSAGNHANLAKVLSVFVMDSDDKDLEHMYFLDSRSFECRTFAMFVNVSRVSPALQDAYLDMRRTLDNGFPLETDHFLNTLATRLAISRTSYTTSLVNACCDRKGDSESLRVRWHLANDVVRHAFCKSLVAILKDAIVFKKGEPEEFEESAVLVRSLEIIDVLRSALDSQD